MKISGERYFPQVGNLVFAPFEPFVSYEHWHRYCYTLPFVKGKTVLDIASGEGYGSAFLAAHASLVYGVDISEEAVQHARASYVRDNLHYLLGAADAIPIPGEHNFDVIVSFETVEHLDAPTQERFAAEITRLLKPDGVLLISTPNRATYSKDGQQENLYHLHEFTRYEFLEFLRQHFAHVRLLSQHVYPISYIWNMEGPSGPMVEYQMSLEDGRFRPVVGDGKEIGYLIAVCAHREESVTGSDSMLVDLSEVAFRGIPRLQRWQTTSLFLDTGAGFRAEEMVWEGTEYTPEFTLEFALDPSTPVRQLRWDPLETRLCRVCLRQVLWQDGDGLISRLDLSCVTSNGRQRDEGTFEFETLDPMIYLPISGPVARVTIMGECEVADVPASMAGMEQALQSRMQELARQDHDLQAVRERLATQEQAAEAYRSQMDRQLEGKDRQLEQKDRQLEQKDRELAHTIGERDRAEMALVEIRRALAEQNLWLAHKDEQLAWAEATLAGAFGSRSWRITAPLRASGRQARGARRRVGETGRAAVNAARKCLRALPFARRVKRSIAAMIARWKARNGGHVPLYDEAVHTAVPLRRNPAHLDHPDLRNPELTSQRQHDQSSRSE